MANCRKRGAPSGSVPASSRPRQRSRPSSDRKGMLQRMKAAAVVALTRLSGEETESSDDSIDVAGKVSDARTDGSSGIAADKGKRNMNSAEPPLQAAMTSTAAMSTLQKSISRNRSKPYSRWPATLLQTACSLRGIAGQSKQRDGVKMIVLLENYDKILERPSPYLADLEERAGGGTAASNPPAGAEEANTPSHVELVTAVRATSNAGASIDPNKMNDFDGKSYAAESILAVIGAEDAEAGAKSTTSDRRKSKHCVPRASELMVDDRWRERLAGSRTPLSKAELDNKETGGKRDVYLDLWKSFKDENVKVVNSLGDDPLIISADINPNIVHQPDIYFDKFMNMLKEAIKEFGNHEHNFKKSGCHDPWWSCCQGNLDSYYYGHVVWNYPEIQDVCDQLLPVDVQRETTGVGGGAAIEGGADAAAADAKRREAAKRKAREDKGKRKINSAGPSLRRAVASEAVMSTLQKSIYRNGSKPYSQWPNCLLQTACLWRGIAGQSKQKDREKMAFVLESYDKAFERSSPYMVDLEDRAAGGTAASNPPAEAEEANTPPHELVTAARAASNAGESIDPNKMYDFDGKSYAAKNVLEVIGAEDAEARAKSTTSGRQKTKHCVPRTTELMVDDRWRERLAGSRTQLSKAELDNKEMGGKRDVYLDLWKSFKDENVKVINSLGDDPLVISANINPNIVHQPDISFDKFMNMLKKVIKEFGNHDHSFKQSGSHDQWWSFCQGNVDSYYYGAVMKNHPEIRAAVCDQLLPVDVQRENTGMGGGAATTIEGGADAAAADSKKREAAKRKAREDITHLINTARRGENPGNDLEEAASVTLQAVSEGLGLPSGGLSELIKYGAAADPARKEVPPSSRESIDSIDSKVAKIKYTETLFEAYFRAKEELDRALKAAEQNGGDTNSDKIFWLETRVEKLKVEMEAWKAEAL